MPAALVIRQLIDLGESGQDAIPQTLSEAHEAWSVLHHIDWDQVADRLGETDLRHVIHGLVRYSRSGRQLGGSVSPVIRLWHVYARRFPGREPELTDWVVTNRTNDYEPFGSLIGSNARSSAEHALQHLLHGAKRQENEQVELERQRAAAHRRAVRATERLAPAVRRGDVKAIAALLAQGADPEKALRGGASLVDLAAAHGRAAVVQLLKERGFK